MERHNPPPVVAKKNGVFLFTFSIHEDLTDIYESLTFFLFYHPPLLKKYESDMIIGKSLVNLSTVVSERTARGCFFPFQGFILEKR